MSHDLQPTEISLRVADHADIVEMAKLLADVFHRKDPLATASGFSKTKLEALAQVFGGKSAREALSIIAVSPATGNIVGALLAHDFATLVPDEIAQIDLDNEPVMPLLDGLEEKFRATHDIVPGNVLHLFMAAVHDDWTGKGLAQSMVRACLENAAARGYRIAFAEATNKTSRQVVRKAGFEQTHMINYDTFDLNGQKPFASISDQVGCALMEIVLD